VAQFVGGETVDVQACGGDCGVELAGAPVVGPQRLPAASQEEQVMVVAAGEDGFDLGAEERGDGDGSWLAGFGQALVLDAVDLVEGAGDADAAFGEVDSADADGGGFAPADAGVGQQADEGGVDGCAGGGLLVLGARRLLALRLAGS
jgi:hypothetical protein